MTRTRLRLYSWIKEKMFDESNEYNESADEEQAQGRAQKETGPQAGREVERFPTNGPRSP